MKNLIDNSVVQHNSNPPLRWIANWAGLIGSSGLLNMSYLEDEAQTDTFRYKFYVWKWDTFWPIYRKYGTFYTMDIDLNDNAWNEYDENGVPYWDFVEENTNDAFRVIEPKGRNQYV